MPKGLWWQTYRDPLLDQLEVQVDAANQTLASAVAHYDAARDAVAEARSGLFPFVNLEATTTTNRQSATRPLRSTHQPNQFGNITIGGQATYEIDFWGQIRNTVAAARAGAQATAADMETVRLSLHAELAGDYLALRGLDAEVKLLDDTVTAFEKALELTEARHTGNISSGLDVSRAQTQLESARADLADAQAQRALFEDAIAVLVGKTASTFSITPTVQPIVVPEMPPGIPSTLLQRRPDIAAAERRVAAANAIIGVTRAAFYPNVSLNLAGGFQNNGGGNLLAAPYSFWSIGPDINLPVFEGGLRHAEEAAAWAQLRATAADYRETVLNAFREVEDDLSQLRDLQQEAERENAAVKAAQRTLDLSLSLYRNGAVNYLDVVVAQTAALQAEVISLNLQTRRLQASVDLVRALGGGWSTKDLPDNSAVEEISARHP